MFTPSNSPMLLPILSKPDIEPVNLFAAHDEGPQQEWYNFRRAGSPATPAQPSQPTPAQARLTEIWTRINNGEWNVNPVNYDTDGNAEVQISFDVPDHGALASRDLCRQHCEHRHDDFASTSACSNTCGHTLPRADNRKMVIDPSSLTTFYYNRAAAGFKVVGDEMILSVESRPGVYRHLVFARLV